MKKVDLGQAIVIFANIGVIAGIVFLAFEIQQNTTQMRAEAALGSHQDLQRLNEAMYQDEEFAELIVRGEQDYACLDPIDQRRLEFYFFSELNLADLVSAFEDEGLSDVSLGIVDIFVNRFESMPGRIQFIDSNLVKGDFEASAMRSDKLYRRLVSESNGQVDGSIPSDC